MFSITPPHRKPYSRADAWLPSHLARPQKPRRRTHHKRRTSPAYPGSTPPIYTSPARSAGCRIDGNRCCRLRSRARFRYRRGVSRVAVRSPAPGSRSAAVWVICPSSSSRGGRRKMKRHVGAELLRHPATEFMELGVTVVFAGDQQSCNLDPDPGLVFQIF